MTIQLQKPDITELKPRISVFGVGGGGGNAVNNMINAGLQGVEFVVANTDAQALTMSKAERRIQLGVNATDGLGAGSHPEIGREAAEECLDEILDHLGSSHMVFVTAGMGGGTGTGAAPVIARAAREKGILTVGVVTKPFHFEGQRRMKTAEAGIEELQKNVDTLIVIPNQNLFRIATEQTTFADAFSMADQVLYSGVASITDLMVHEGLVNLDFADVRSVMQKMGKAMMGTGEASDSGRALAAAEAAIANPLLDETSMRGARGLLISITGGRDMTLFEVDEAANRIREEVDPDANVIFGAIIDEALEGIIRVSVVATGIDARAADMDDSAFIGSGGANLAGQAAQRQDSGAFLKKESPGGVNAEAELAIRGSAEEERSDAGARESQPETRLQSRIFGAAPQGAMSGALGSGQNRAPMPPAYAKDSGSETGADVSEADEDFAADMEAEAAAAENAAARQQPLRSAAADSMMGAALNSANMGGLGGAAQRPQMRPQLQNPAGGQGQMPQRQSGQALPAAAGMDDFPAELRTLRRPENEEREEAAGGVRGFWSKLKGAFGGGEEMAARLEPAEEQNLGAFRGQSGQGGSRLRNEAAYGAEMPPRGDALRAGGRRPNAPMQRPDTMLAAAPRGASQMRPEEREEEKLEIPAFLRRQSH